jgi:UbiD family decarboxylase
VASQCHSGAYAGKYVIVVDEDIDPSDLEEVIWAVCTRSDPATSIEFIRRAWSTPLDPRLTPEQRAAGDFTNSRALIDATLPWEWRESFPPVNVPPLGQRRAALDRWAYLLS